MTNHEDSEGGWNTGLHSYFDVRHNKDGRVVSSTRRLHFTPKEIPGCSFLLQVECTSRLLSAERRKRTLENFQRHYRESNPESPILWRSASTNSTARPINFIHIHKL